MNKDTVKQNNVETLSFSAEAGLGTPIITSGYSIGGNRYIPYSSDSMRYNSVNNYPQLLAKLSVESPTHGAAINMKAMLTKGKGFDKETLSRNIKKVLNRMNDKNQSIDDILEQVARDYVTFGGFALKVSWNYLGKIASVERIMFTDVRCGEPDEDFNVNYYVVSNDWDNTMPTRFKKTYSLPVFNPSYFEDEFGNPKPVKFENGQYTPDEAQSNNAQQIIYFYKESFAPASNGMYFYPVPDYAAGIDCIMQEVDINTANKSMINNGVGGKTIVNFTSHEPNEDKKRDLVKRLVKAFTGADKNGGIMVNIGSDPETFPTFTNLPAMEADTYNSVHEIVIQTIVTTHNIPAILLNLRSGGSWSNTADEMEQAFQIFNKTKIAAYQQDIERVFNTVLGYMGYDVELQIVPFSLNEPQDITSDETSKEVESQTANNETTSLDSK